MRASPTLRIYIHSTKVLYDARYGNRGYGFGVFLQNHEGLGYALYCTRPTRSYSIAPVIRTCTMRPASSDSSISTMPSISGASR